MILPEVIRLLREELERATADHPLFNSPHEGYAVLLEEVLELQAEVFLKHGIRSHDCMIVEAVQIAAMAVKFILSLPPE